MKKSEELKGQIDKLQGEYKKALMDESKISLWDDGAMLMKASETIGFFNISKTKVILSALYEGKVLLLEHMAMGNYKVYMNSQRNRILIEQLDTVERQHDVNEENIMGFIVWHAGNWFIISENYEHPE